MKKLFLFSLVMFSTLTVSAQYWQQYKSEGDELKGTENRSYHGIKIPNKCLVSIDNEDFLQICTLEGIFDFERFRSHTVVDGIFGMYNEKGVLVEKEKIMLLVNDQSPEWAMTANGFPYERVNENGIKKVANWIRSNSGSIRVVIPRYGKTDFDVTLPTFLSQKVFNSKQSSSKGSQQKSTKKPIRRK